MSSKLHRGLVASQPIQWDRVSSHETDESDLVESASSGSPRVSEERQAAQSAVVHQQELDAAFQAGQAAARQEMSGQLNAIQLRMARTIEEMTGLRQRFRHEAEEDIVALSLAIARRVLHRELTVAPEAILGLLNVALEKIAIREVHRVRARPEDAGIIRQHLEKMGLPQRIEVVADPALERGAAILESTRGSLDASVETQLMEIERGFADVVRRV
jgi:flagellar assembly protein FliH